MVTKTVTTSTRRSVLPQAYQSAVRVAARLWYLKVFKPAELKSSKGRLDSLLREIEPAKHEAASFELWRWVTCYYPRARWEAVYREIVGVKLLTMRDPRMGGLKTGGRRVRPGLTEALDVIDQLMVEGHSRRSAATMVADRMEKIWDREFPMTAGRRARLIPAEGLPDTLRRASTRRAEPKKR